jgi:hypothetical protein
MLYEERNGPHLSSEDVQKVELTDENGIQIICRKFYFVSYFSVSSMETIFRLLFIKL